MNFHTVMGHSDSETMTCGTCGRQWCGLCTPTPAARCPFEYDHEETSKPWKTWTFFGHWEQDRLVIDHAVVGQHEDVYPGDASSYEQGLWASSATGATIEEAEANVRAEYEGDDEDDE